MGTSPPLSGPNLSRIAWAILLTATTFGMSTTGECGAQQLRLEKVWEIGSVDGPPEATWMRIADATVLKGYVYALDSRLPTVRRFTIEGEYVGDLGRRGGGPGEYARPFAVHSQQESLWIYDIGLFRWVVINATGEHARTVRPPSPPGQFSRVWQARYGWLLGLTPLIGRSTPEASESRHLVIAWDSLSRTDTLAAFEGNPFWTLRNWTQIPNMVTTNSLGADGDAWMVGDSLLVVVDGVVSRARVYRATPHGFEKVRERSLPGERIRLSDRDREAAIAWYYRRVNVDPPESTIVDFVVPEWWPAWTVVRADDQDGVWIRRGGAWRVDPDSGERWVRWSLRNDDIQEVELPVGVEALQFREAHLVGLRKGEFGVESLVLYRISGL